MINKNSLIHSFFVYIVGSDYLQHMPPPVIGVLRGDTVTAAPRPSNYSLLNMPTLDNSLLCTGIPHPGQ